MNLTELEKAYIAGFLDGDGCIMFQLVRRKDYILGYQVRASMVFYQKVGNEKILKWLKSKLGYGYIRFRKDEMVEYTIVGKNMVTECIKILHPYLRIKRKHADLTLKIDKKWPERFDSQNLLALARLVDQFKDLNYSKRRTNTIETLQEFFANNPRND